MLINKETEYAILGLTALSHQKEHFYDVKVLAKDENISKTLLSKVFQKLARAHILESRIGPNGGFRLNKDPEQLTLLEIIEVAQSLNVLKCCNGKAPYCRKTNCYIKNTIRKLEKLL